MKIIENVLNKKKKYIYFKALKKKKKKITFDSAKE